MKEKHVSLKYKSDFMSKIYTKITKKELFWFVGNIILAILIFGFIFGFFVTDYDIDDLFGIMIRIIGPISLPVYIWGYKQYWLFILFFLPYILFLLFRTIFKKLSVKKCFYLSAFVSVLLYIFITPLVFSCDVKNNDLDEGYFKTSYSVCFNLMVSPISPRSYDVVEIKNADFDSFEVFDENNKYAKDKNSVYFGFVRTFCPDCYWFVADPEKKIEGADPKTFEILEDGYARDKNNCYKSGEPIDCEFLISSSTMP